MSSPAMLQGAAPGAGASPPESPGDASVRAALAGYLVPGPVLDELAAYSRSRFAPVPGLLPDAGLPLPDEPFVATWERYLAEARRVGVWACLRERLVQLRFPVSEGISRSAAYRAATARGVLPAASEGASLRDPDGLSLLLHATPAGRIPVLVAARRSDFVTLVRALTLRNEPVAIPDSMGACIVGGYNNWDRIRELRRSWEASHPGGSEAEWQLRFRSVVPQKELYQDRFILLSSGCYSATPAADLGVDAEAWKSLSLTIRLEHECAHYFTRRVFGSMRNSLHDEVLADYAGIRAAAGEFKKEWFLRFLGLESFPAYRPGGRLENYRGAPPLTDGAFRLLQAIVVRAADQLELLDRVTGDFHHPAVRARLLSALALTSLPELALPGAAARIGRLAG